MSRAKALPSQRTGWNAQTRALRALASLAFSRGETNPWRESVPTLHHNSLRGPCAWQTGCEQPLLCRRFRYYLTLLAECFAPFEQSTCALSVSCRVRVSSQRYTREPQATGSSSPTLEEAAKDRSSSGLFFLNTHGERYPGGFHPLFLSEARFKLLERHHRGI